MWQSQALKYQELLQPQSNLLKHMVPTREVVKPFSHPPNASTLTYTHACTDCPLCNHV